MKRKLQVRQTALNNFINLNAFCSVLVTETDRRVGLPASFNQQEGAAAASQEIEPRQLPDDILQRRKQTDRSKREKLPEQELSARLANSASS